MQSVTAQRARATTRFVLSLPLKLWLLQLKIIAPWRIWDIKSREDAVDYAEAHGIEVPVTKERFVFT